MSNGGDTPHISVIIPTHNRHDSLRRLLNALCAQTYPLRRVEVIVVADGCKDDTAEMVRGYHAPFALHVIEQPGLGAATARNEGAARAMGRRLVFLDDDIEPTASLLEAHERTHSEGGPRQVVMGYSLPIIEGRLGFFTMALRNWWQDEFYAMRRPGHRYTYRDLLSGNFSIESQFFARLNGFDRAYPDCGGEDYEFGVRALKAGARFAFAADAMGRHYDNSNLERSLQRTRHEGRVDVLISRRHPELCLTLKLAKIATPTTRLKRALRSLAFMHPSIGDALAARLFCTLGWLERARMRARWARVHHVLREYWYWRGVAEETGSKEALMSFVRDTPARAGEGATEIDLDLREGLVSAERRLDEQRPASVRLRYGKQMLGIIPPQPGTELLRGAHLRPLLATEFAAALLPLLALEKARDDGTNECGADILPEDKSRCLNNVSST